MVTYHNKPRGFIVLQKKLLTQSWAIGTDTEQTSSLRKALGDEHELILLSVEDVRHMPKNDIPGSPFVLWLSLAAAKNLAEFPNSFAQQLADTPKVLLLGKQCLPADFEFACDYECADILRYPLAANRIANIMRKALEAQLMQSDMECMAREIVLERELLERKNEILSFLVEFLAKATESVDLEHLLQTAYSGLKDFIPLYAMHAVFWDRGNDGSSLLSLHICAPESSKAHEIWREKLLEQARNVIGNNFAVEEITRLKLAGQIKRPSQLPDEKHVLVLPLISGEEPFGALLLETVTDRHLGRDQAVALDSAIRHFSLNVKNAKKFRQMQMYADYDALTKVHSRRHFENRLDEELARLARYNGTLSMLMLDIDHFKKVNDTYGHHSGDIVLREVAAIVAGSIRSTDYCARYGGEEFIILLPNTSIKMAMTLAERIRCQVAAHNFVVDDNASLNITVSLGLSCLTGDWMKNKQALICEADAALYEAKKSGRNCIAVAPKTTKNVYKKRDTA